MVPEGWVISQFGKVCKVEGGFAFKSKDFIDEVIQLWRRNPYVWKKHASKALNVSHKWLRKEFVGERGQNSMESSVFGRKLVQSKKYIIQQEIVKKLEEWADRIRYNVRED